MPTNPVWLLDVDGVINASRPGWGAAPTAKQVWSSSSHREFRIRWAPALLNRIRRIHAAGLAEIRWCTTWCADADALEAALGLPHFTRAFTDPINGRVAAMAKLAAASQVLAEGRRLVWTDDTETPTEGELYERLTFDGKALLIAPHPSRGLQPDDLDRIDAFLGAEKALLDATTALDH
ncbi:hypothetical protein ACWKSP_22280 [Micromonosporaceae bacterium Da 78-11]